MKRYQIRAALTQYLNEINLPINTLESLCGFSDRYLYKMEFCLSEKKIDAIIAVLPNLNKEYLMTGNGPIRNGTDDTIINQSLPAMKSADNPEFREGVMGRLEQILHEEGFRTVRDYEKYIRTFRGIWDNAKKRGNRKVILDWVNRVLEDFPDYSYDWVIFGTGSMKRAEGTTLHLCNTIEELISPDKSTEQYILPLLKKADLLYRLSEDSVDKKIRRGDIVAIKTLPLQEIECVNLSKQFLLVPKNDEPTLARIRPDNDKVIIFDESGSEIHQIKKEHLIYIGQLVGSITLQ